jgi:hypothetical protein
VGRQLRLSNERLDHPNETDIIVIAWGEGYIVDPETRILRNRFGGSIEEVIPLPDLKIIVFRSCYHFEAIAADGPLWRSSSISTDGMRNIIIAGSELRGEAYAYFDDSWHPFTLDLLTGKCSGPFYPDTPKDSTGVAAFLHRWIGRLAKFFRRQP